MTRRFFQTIVLALLITSKAFAQTVTDPFPNPIPTSDRVIAVKFGEFATIPDFNGMAPRLMTMVNEPRTRRLFASDIDGQIFLLNKQDGIIRLLIP